MIVLIHAWNLLGRCTTKTLHDVCSHKVMHRSAISLADQIVVSASSFLVIIFLGRACLPDELGLYSVGFSLVTLLLGIPNALVWTPYTTFVPGMAEEDSRWYSGSTLAHQMLLGTAMAFGVSAVGALIWQSGGMKELGVMLMFLGPVTLLLSARECVRRICFSRLNVGQAFAVDVVISALQTGGMLLLAAFGLLSATRAYLVIGGACLPVIVVWLIVNRTTFSVRCKRIVADCANNWKLSRWLLASSLVFSLNDVLFPCVLSWLHGAASVGILSAANGTILLANPLILGFTNFFGPHAVDVYTRVGISGLYRQIVTAWMAMATMMLLFTLASIIWGAYFVTLLFGAKYAGQETLIFALALGQFAEVATIPFALGLLAVGRGDSVLATYVVRLAITATVGMWCVQHFGAPGVGYGRALSNFGAVVSQWWIFRSLPLSREAKI